MDNSIVVVDNICKYIPGSFYQILISYVDRTVLIVQKDMVSLLDSEIRNTCSEQFNAEVVGGMNVSYPFVVNIRIQHVDYCASRWWAFDFAPCIGTLL